MVSRAAVGGALRVEATLSRAGGTGKEAAVEEDVVVADADPRKALRVPLHPHLRGLHLLRCPWRLPPLRRRHQLLLLRLWRDSTPPGVDTRAAGTRAAAGGVGSGRHKRTTPPVATAGSVGATGAAVGDASMWAPGLLMPPDKQLAVPRALRDTRRGCALLT
jgi:hypothetical protein